MQDPLSEDDNEDIHHAVKYSILQLNSAESNYVGEQLKPVFTLQADLYIIIQVCVFCLLYM